MMKMYKQRKNRIFFGITLAVSKKNISEAAPFRALRAKGILVDDTNS